MNVIRLGGLYDTKEQKRQAGSIYSTEGLCPTLDTSGGGYHEPLIIVEEKDERDDKQIEK